MIVREQAILGFRAYLSPKPQSRKKNTQIS